MADNGELGSVEERAMALVKGRMVDRMLGSGVDEARIRRHLREMKDDGSWADVEYGDRSRSSWKAPVHLKQLREMAIAYREGSLPTGSRDAVLTALDFWLENDFQNPNWWWNEIGVPGNVSEVLLLLEPELKPAQRDRGLAILERAAIGMTGQNLVWVAHITARRGILEGDPSLVKEAFGRIAEELRVTREEGLQPDFSFHQHGPLLYSHGYGAGFAVDCSRIATLLRGTPFAFPREKVELLIRYILDGSRWMTRGRALDFGANGREITRRNQDASYLETAARAMLELGAGREEELQACIAGIQDPTDWELRGNRMFWCSDFMVHQSPQFYASARMYSARTANTDQPCNSEGLKSHHIADGCTCIMRTGDAYRNIYPLWDWQKVPGTTVIQKPELGDVRRRGTTDFVGGVSTGEHGMAAFDFQDPEDPLRARKAWAFLEDRFIALGAGIESCSGYAVVTTLNQCHLRGEVVVRREGEGPRELERGDHALGGVRWVVHDRVAYLFPESTDIRMEIGTARGSWGEINRQYSREEVEGEVFKLWIDHGTNPRGARYAYTVAPEVGVEGAERLMNTDEARILTNGPRVQAASGEGGNLLLAALYTPGEVPVSRRLWLAARQPCVIVLRDVGEGDAGRLELTVADPTQTLDALQFAVLRRPGEGGKRDVLCEVRVDLPGGMYAGRGVSRSLSW